MTVSFRAADVWRDGATGLTASTCVLTPPSGLAAGDLWLALAAWKDFSITVTADNNMSVVSTFTDGSTGTGNGTGSMKVGAWWKTASASEGNTTLTFSTTTNLLGEATSLVFQKSLARWSTPTFATGAWPLQSSGTVVMSTTSNVPNGGAVVLLVGIRDDSATFNMTAGSITSDGTVTFNGNYVESPATHASTTTGNDMSADAGYRLVTTGNATAQLSGAISSLSASETGAMMLIILGDTTAAPPFAKRHRNLIVR